MEWLIISGLLGLAVGSFLNVVILRLPLIIQREWESDCHAYLKENAYYFPFNTTLSSKFPSTPFNLVFPSSHCPSCQRSLSILENIPLISFIFLKGQCRTCHNKISWRYPFIELLTAIGTVFLMFHFGPTYKLLGALLFTWSLIVLIMIDIDHQLLPDNITLPLLWVGLIFNLSNSFVPLHRAVIGAIAGYLFLYCVFWLFKVLTGKEGLGHGDFKLLAALGAWTGWTSLPVIILLGSLSGALYGIFLILFHRHSRHQPIPFGPFLAIAGWIALLWGDKIVTTYLALSHIS